MADKKEVKEVEVKKFRINPDLFVQGYTGKGEKRYINIVPIRFVPESQSDAREAGHVYIFDEYGRTMIADLGRAKELELTDFEVYIFGSAKVILLTKDEEKKYINEYLKNQK